MARYACCEPVSRGLAMWRDKIIIATLDGRLIALDKATGQPVWTTQTFERDFPYSITGAPRVFGDKVVVGQSGGDFGVRGFVAAYDADDRRAAVEVLPHPRRPGQGPDGEASDAVMAWIRADLVRRRVLWKLGGGANPWDSIAYDPELDLVYVGTGNASPHSRYYRSDNQGDNLFVCSIVALHADDRRIRLALPDEPGRGVGLDLHQLDHHRRPDDRRQAAQGADAGAEERLLLRARPRDRRVHQRQEPRDAELERRASTPTGGRSTSEAVRYGFDPALVMPGPGGAHNWFPMAYSPRTGLAYFPAYQSGFVYALAARLAAAADALEQRLGRLRRRGAAERAPLQAQANAIEKAWLTAWDPVRQQVAWQVELPRHGNGGVFVTASDLVFEGTTRQTFAAFDARNGRMLWEFPTQSAPVAGGITYMLDGVQYVAINAGWGGGAAQIEQSRRHRAAARQGPAAGVQARRHRAAAAARGHRRDPAAAAAARARGADPARRAAVRADLRGVPRRSARSAGSRTCAT